MGLDLAQRRAVHVVGVGGAGMSAIAEVLARMGHRVSGSDLKPAANLERLRGLGVEVHVGHRAEHVGDVDAVTLSTAVPPHNPEVRAAIERGIPLLTRAEVLAAIVATRRTVAVSGTHGKTTTSSMLALVLVEAGLRPSFIIGGDVNEIGSGAVWEDSDLFVVEADESDGTFLELGAEAVVVTSVEGDRGGVTFVDDYAHNPGKVQAVLAAARAGAWRRVVCVFQPHRYTRIATQWREFGAAFDDADLLVVTDVYGNNEAPRPGVSGKL